MSEHSTQVLIVIHDGPYGGERAYNALRLAMNLIKRPQAAVWKRKTSERTMAKMPYLGLWAYAGPPSILCSQS